MLAPITLVRLKGSYDYIRLKESGAYIDESGGCGQDAAVPRQRFAPGEKVFHTLNRCVGRMKVFWSERDCFALKETVQVQQATAWQRHGNGMVVDVGRESS